MTNIIIIIAALLFSAFFSGMEIAFVTSNKLRIELDKKQNLFSAKIISLFVEKPNRYIATMLIGNNISLVIYGIIMANILEPYFMEFTNSEITTLLLQTIVSTVIILITAEFIPKVLFRINPNFALNTFAIPLMFFYIIFYPISYFTIFLSDKIFTKLLPLGFS